MNYNKFFILFLILSINHNNYSAAVADMDLTENTNSGLTPLMLATSEGNFELVKKIISATDYKKDLKKHKETLNGQDMHGRSALHWAILEDKLEIANYLLDCIHIDKNCPDIDQFTPLMLAITTDKIDFFDLLMSKKVRIHDKNKNGLTAIHLAIINKNKIMIEKLSDLWDDFENLIKFTIKRKLFDLLTYFEKTLNSVKFYVYAQKIITYHDNNSYQEDEISALKLLQEGANISHSSIQDCWHDYFMNNCPKKANKIIIALIDKGIDVNQEIDYKGKALHYACLNQNNEIVKCLIDHKALINEINGASETPLHKTIALRLKYTFTIPFNFTIALNLIEAGADVNKKDSNGKSFLNRYFSDQQKEFRYNPIEILKLLINYNANVNSQDNRGNTPLHHLVHEAPEIEEIKMLLDAKADPNLKNIENKSAFDNFISTRTMGLQEYKMIIKLFFDYGAK